MDTNIDFVFISVWNRLSAKVLVNLKLFENLMKSMNLKKTYEHWFSFYFSLKSFECKSTSKLEIVSKFDEINEFEENVWSFVFQFVLNWICLMDCRFWRRELWWLYYGLGWSKTGTKFIKWKYLLCLLKRIWLWLDLTQEHGSQFYGNCRKSTNIYKYQQRLS